MAAPTESASPRVPKPSTEFDGAGYVEVDPRTGEPFFLAAGDIGTPEWRRAWPWLVAIFLFVLAINFAIMAIANWEWTTCRWNYGLSAECPAYQPVELTPASNDGPQG